MSESLDEKLARLQAQIQAKRDSNKQRQIRILERELEEANAEERDLEQREQLQRQKQRQPRIRIEQKEPEEEKQPIVQQQRKLKRIFPIEVSREKEEGVVSINYQVLNVGLTADRIDYFAREIRSQVQANQPLEAVRVQLGWRPSEHPNSRDYLMLMEVKGDLELDKLKSHLGQQIQKIPVQSDSIWELVSIHIVGIDERG
jgi:hypothetical protein